MRVRGLRQSEREKDGMRHEKGSKKQGREKQGSGMNRKISELGV